MYLKLLFLIFVISEATEYGQSVPCQLKQVNYGQVCVNDVNHCDTLDVPLAKSKNDYTLVTSSFSGERFVYKYGETSPRHQLSNNDTYVEVDREKQGCKFVGFGGGFSGAVSYVLNRLPKNLRKCVYKSYFSNNVGMGLMMLRLTMGGTSFDEAPWTYNETPVNDILLSNFTKLDPRDVQRNSQIREIMKISKHPDFKIMAVPYSAPPWMKGNNNFVGGANSQLKVEYYQAWANYYTNYLYYMEEAGIPIWAVTTGDEPGVGLIASELEFMGWKATEQGAWVGNYLGPTIRNSPHKNVKILVFDDNRAEIVKYLAEMELGAADVMTYADAIAVHGHSDYKSSSTLLDEIRVKYPKKPIYMTEKSFGIGTVPKPLKGVLLGSWQRAENFTTDLIDNLNHGVTAFLYWNFILDYLGGPNYAKNYIDSPIIVNETYYELYKQPMFYAFAHFAKFIPVGSRRITVEIHGTDVSLIYTVAYLCPDGTISMVLYNVSETQTVTLYVVDKKKGEIRLVLSPKSINTLIY